MMILKAYAQPKNGGGGGGTPSTSATNDDARYTSWAVKQARSAGIRNPEAYVNRNVKLNAAPAERNRVMGQVNRGR